MENSKNSNIFVDKYNFSRRVVDHRIPYDFHYSINHPILSNSWRLAWKQRVMGNILYTFGIYVSGFCATAIPLFVLADGFYRYATEEDAGRHGNALAPKQQYGERFIMNHKNQISGKGRWNYTHFCWENEPNCGKDFDWVKKENKDE